MSGAGTLAPLWPGATLGVIGGGQLGRYLVLAARRLGYDTWVLDPDAAAPAMTLATHPLVASYDDAEALATLGEACDAVTIEFENVPAASLAQLALTTRVAPSADSVRVAQDRVLEKRAAAAAGLVPVPYAVIEEEPDIAAALATIPLPAILKTARLGYDGKGQHLCRSAADVQAGWRACGGVTCVLERRVELAAELSVVLARGLDGTTRGFPVARNVHVGGILHLSTVPAPRGDVPGEVAGEVAGDAIDEALCDEAQRLATALADALDHHGILAVEFFVDGDGKLLFNEMAPRPHNSGHYTLDATSVCQFEAQLRVLCGLPLETPELLRPVTMLNLLGDAWRSGAPDWSAVLGTPGARLHLYGKAAARAGRKMGHVNCTGDDRAATLRTAESLHRTLDPSN